MPEYSNIEIRTTKDGYGTEIVVDGEPLDMEGVVAFNLAARVDCPTTLTVERVRFETVKVTGPARFVEEDLDA